MTPHRLHIWPWLRAPCQRLIMKDWLAITIWIHVFAWRALDDVELAHELAHVAQWRRHGPMFVVHYLAASRKAAKAGMDRYRENHFEIEAREAEAAVRGRRPV